MDEIIRKITEGQESGLPKTMAYVDDSYMRMIEKKFQSIIMAYKD
jgi:hypothetical protein